MPLTDHDLVESFLALCRGMDGVEIADAVGVTPGNVSKWRKGKWRGNLRAPTRVAIEKILAQPDWKYVPSAPPSEAEERSAAEQAHYAAGVLWSIAQDAEHLARKAREAHTRITGKTPGKIRSADAVAATAAEALAEKKRLGVSAKHGRRQHPPKQA